ncbi:MFS transporter [Pararhizobium sp.]|uniref:MFS transporter n=1 Tax=Pararhizobium sp. TaxID=1977563 RepID=UPI003D14CB56
MQARSSDGFSLAFTAACVAMASVTYGMGRYAYGLFLPSIRQDFNLSTFDLAMIASLNTAVYLLATVIASGVAIYFRPRTLIVLAGLVTTSGLLIAGLAASFPVAAGGIILAGAGGGILSPAMFEAIEAWLSARWKGRAIAAVNAGAAPGLILTGLAAYWLQSSWQQAWIAMAGIGLAVTLWNAWLLPDRRLAQAHAKPKLPLRPGLFLRAECMPLYLSLFVYGLLFSTYLTFAVDLILSTGGLVFPADRLFWVLLGLAGLPAMFTGRAVSRFGVRGLLAVSLPVCGLSYALLAMAPGHQTVVLISAILFGVSSIAPGNGFLVWGISLFRERPSAGTGAVFVALSLATIAGPILVGLFSERIDLLSVFYIVAMLSVLTIPLSPRGMFGTEETVAGEPQPS